MTIEQKKSPWCSDRCLSPLTATILRSAVSVVLFVLSRIVDIPADLFAGGDIEADHFDTPRPVFANLADGRFVLVDNVALRSKAAGKDKADENYRTKNELHTRSVYHITIICQGL